MLMAGTANAHPPWGIVVTRGGVIYFTDIENVWKIDNTGRVTLVRPKREGHVHELSLDPPGNLLGAENSYDPATKRFFSATWRMTPDGKFTYLLPLTEHPPNGTSIWMDSGGNQYHVATDRQGELLVLKRAPSDSIQVLVGTKEALRSYRQGVPYGTGGMAFGQDGALYFTHGPNASKLVPGGAVTPLVRNMGRESSADTSERYTALMGIAVAANGDVFLADYWNGRVLRLGPNGKQTTVLKVEAPWFPCGVAVHGNGLYVLEEGHTPDWKSIGARVREVTPSGDATLLAQVADQKVVSQGVRRGAPDTAAAAGDATAQGEKPRRSSSTAVVMGVGVVAFVLMVGFARKKRERAAGEQDHRRGNA
jgi:sugar lactone lactonase YvrE